MGVQADIQTLEPSARIELFELDCQALGGDLMLYHGYNQAQSIWWQGNEYKYWPIQTEGFSITGEGQQPTPTLRVGNIEGTIGALTIYLRDLVGAKLTRRRTLAKYLDARNFPNGNPTADPNEKFADDVWYVNQKTFHDNEVIEFQMKSALDLSGTFLPRRLILANLCSWRYRSAECGYVSGAMYDINDVPTSDPSKDQCGKKVSSCKLHFGEHNPLPYGGFPSATLIRT